MIKMVFLISFVLSPNVYAQDASSISDYAFASTLKTLAKTFIQTVGVEKLKKKHLKSLHKMSDGKFHKRYAEVFVILKDIPSKLRVEYGINENMSKDKTIAMIERLDNKKVLSFIDRVPDQVVVKHANDYLKQMSHEAKVNNQMFLQQINSLWEKVIHKA